MILKNVKNRACIAVAVLISLNSIELSKCFAENKNSFKDSIFSFAGIDNFGLRTSQIKIASKENDSTLPIRDFRNNKKQEKGANNQKWKKVIIIGTGTSIAIVAMRLLIWNFFPNSVFDNWFKIVEDSATRICNGAWQFVNGVVSFLHNMRTTAGNRGNVLEGRDNVKTDEKQTIVSPAESDFQYVKKTAKEKFKDDISEKDFVVVDFYKDKCSFCQKIDPILEQIQDENKIDIMKVNVLEKYDIANEYRVTEVPTIVIFKKGKIISTRKGYTFKAEMLSWISKYIRL